MVERYRGYVADSARWDGFVHREGDIVISAPSKCGTTWMQMLVALLVFEGEPPAPVATLSPWVDMRIRSEQELDELVSAQKHRRFLKTHVPLDGLPLDGRVTYVVVGRDPRDAWLSVVDHRLSIDRERLAELIGEHPPAPEPDAPDWRENPVGAFQVDVAAPRGSNHATVRPAHVLHHLATGWERRAEPNVTLHHYADLVADLPGELVHLAHALGLDVTKAQSEQYAAAATLEQMRSTAASSAPDADRGLWQDPSAFFARGRVGEWRTAFPPAVLAAYDERVAALHPDEEFLVWVHGGRRGTPEWRSV